MFYKVPHKRINRRFKKRRRRSQEELGFLKKLGKGLKKVGKVVGKGALKVGAVSGIPGISQVAGMVEGMLPSGGKSEDKLRKNCAKKPSGKGCAALFANDKAIADAQAKAEADTKAKAEREQAMIDALTNKQNAGLDTNTMMLIGGGVGAVLLLILLTKN